MRASVEALCAIASVEEERLALLDLGELIFQTFDLQNAILARSQRYFEIASSPRTVLPVAEGLQFWTTP